RMKANIGYCAYGDLSGKEIGQKEFMASKKQKFWIDLERDLGHIRKKIGDKDYSVLATLKVLMTIPCIEPFNVRDIRPGLEYLKNKIVTKVKKEIKKKA
ncbi:hypothetical protein JW979_04275, partial [bacterium]|nr:hypothetical protein [candidate division CSSED10-310 bacterium]